MQREINEKLIRLSKTKYLIYYETAMEKLKKTDKEFKKLADKNSQLYHRNEAISKMSDGNDIDISMITEDVLNDLVEYHQNLLILYDLLLMEFYFMGKKNLFYEFKKLEIL